MKNKIRNYNMGYKVVSLALDTETKDDLISDNIDFLYVTEKSVFLYPNGEVITEEQEVIDELKTGSNYDVYELWSDGTLYLYFDTKLLKKSLILQLAIKR